jgi:hypothetical protein
MNIKKHVYSYLGKKNLNEGIDESGTPDTKYYAFDWDDNIVFMPTKIMVMSENEEEVGMSTEEFAEHRHQLGVEPFSFKGTMVVGYAPDPFRYFGVQGNKRFVLDSMTANLGPSWNDFVECINGGSIFAIITARGHNPESLKEAVYNFIVGNHNGINSKTLVENLKKYRDFGLETVSEQSTSLRFSNKEIIDEYLDMCRFEPVTYGQGSAANPEELKIVAMRKFITYCQEMAQEIGKRAMFKNDMTNQEFTPKIGFSDDDPRNIEKMKGFLEKEYPEGPVRTYLTKGDIKTEV